jgi:hypothetical protein
MRQTAMQVQVTVNLANEVDLLSGKPKEIRYEVTRARDKRWDLEQQHKYDYEGDEERK